jgi:hypothetical protein
MHYLYNVFYRLRIDGLNPGLGSSSQLFEPRLARLKLGVFEPMDNISSEYEIIHEIIR